MTSFDEKHKTISKKETQMTKKPKTNSGESNPMGLDDHAPIMNIADALLEVARLEGPEAYKKMLESDLFRMATEYDPRYHPELAHPYSDSRKRN